MTGLNLQKTYRQLYPIPQHQVTITGSSEITFIGFGKIPGFQSFEWQDWNWLNASDFDVVFINCASLNAFLINLQQLYSEERESFPRLFNQLWTNVEELKNQILQMIISGQTIFAFAIREMECTKREAFDVRSISTYSWCPLHVQIIPAKPGQRIVVLDDRFLGYRGQIKQWDMFIDMQPGQVQELDHHDLLPHEEYRLILGSLFENRSQQFLGVELRYGVFENGSPGRFKKDFFSGPIYLLHHPLGGDNYTALQSLLNDIYEISLGKSQKPLWVEDISLPKGEELSKKLAEIDTKVNSLIRERNSVLQDKQQMEYWRQLVYETGTVLEDTVMEALKLMRLDNVRRGAKGDHDIVGEFDGESMLFEVKGLTKSAGRREVFDLERHREEYELKNPGVIVSKSVLIVNAYKNDPPEIREQGNQQIFNGDTIQHAKLLGFALLDTRVLYQVVTTIIEGKTVDDLEILRKLRHTTGVFLLD